MDNTIRMNHAERNGSVGLLTGLLIGMLAGFGTMMLFAPQSGKKTRASIQQKSTEFQERATDTFDELVTLSQFDNRKILTGQHSKTEND